MSRAKGLSDNDAELLELIMRYRHEHFDKPFETAHVAAWVIRAKLWKAPPRSLVRELKKELSRVAKRARHSDRQGRTVRTMHAAKYACALSDGKEIQKTLWDHIDTMTVEHAETSFGQRWDQIAGASVSLRTDADSFNENNPNAKGREIYISLNFEGVADAAAASPQQVQQVPLPVFQIDGPSEPEQPS
jgi:hypothetical protein